LEALWQPLARAQHAVLEVSLPEQAVLYGHSSAWLAMLDNLVHNAIRCTPAAASALAPNHIQLTLTHNGDEAIWTLTDHGPGMEARTMDQLNQGLRPQPDHHESGTGLGIHIAMRAAQRHGGHLVFQATPGGGLTVLAHLPRAWGSPDAARTCGAD
jgi:signal transduction histidine kinase